MVEKELHVGEILQKTYDGLVKRNDPKKIILPKRTLSEIADDSDIHRHNVGYMKYEEVNLFNFNSKTLMMGRGEAWGSYPADPYNSDILVLEINPKKETKNGILRKKTDKQLAEEIHTAIERTGYFRNSLIIGMANGRIAGSTKSSLCVKLFEFLKSDLSKFVAKEMEVNRELYTMALKPVVKSGVRYKPELVDYLVEKIESVLKE